MTEKHFVDNPNPWHPMTDSVDLKHLGKLVEELGECQSAAARCIIQGIDEKEPSTGVSNRDWLTNEVADVMANLDLVISHFGLDRQFLISRINKKTSHLKRWHEMA